MQHSSRHLPHRIDAGRRLLTALLAFVVAAGAAATLLAACGGEGTVAAQPAVLARVDGKAVTQDDVDLVLAERRLAGTTVKDEAKAAKDALDQAIDRAVVRGEAERLGLTVSEAEVDARVAQVRDRLGGEEALTSALATSRMTREQLRAGSAYGLLREHLQEAKYEDAGVSDAAVRRFYQRNVDELFTEPAAVRLGSIMFHGINAANGVHEKLVKGAAFDEMARTYSADPTSADGGGMLGWVAVGSLPAPLAEAVAKLEPGGLSEVVEGPGGWYVFKLYGRRPAKVTPFAQVSKPLREELERRARVKALDRWIERARERADVQLLKN